MGERREFEHRARIELAVHTIEEAAPMSDAQRRDLIALLSREIKPFRTTSLYSYYILMSRIANLPEEKIKPLLGDTQWKVWDKRLGGYKNLVAQWGLVLEDEPAEPAVEAK